MKKKIAIIVLLILIVVCCVPTVALANMAQSGTVTGGTSTMAYVYPVLYSSSVEFVEIASSDNVVDSWWNRVGVTMGTILFWCCLAATILATTVVIVVRKIKYKAYGYPVAFKGHFKKRLMAMLILLVLLVVANVVSLSLVDTVGTSMYAVYLVDVVVGFALLSYGVILLDRYITSKNTHNTQQ